MDGRVWLEQGKIVCGRAGLAGEPIDALFELLRLPDGDFTFTADVEAPQAGEPRPVQPLLAEAQSRLVEWRTIEAVVPSLATPARLAAEAPGPTVSIDAD